MPETLYLCDGAVESCTKTGCYKRGHECRHTTDVTHALNSEDKRHFVPDGDRVQARCLHPILFFRFPLLTTQIPVGCRPSQ
mgnify:CR=1 FL=1